MHISSLRMRGVALGIVGLTLLQTWMPYLRGVAFARGEAEAAAVIAVELNIRTSPDVVQTIQRVVNILPPEHTKVVRKLEVNRNSHDPRGLSNGPVIKYNLTQIENEDEAAAILIHEFAHSVDFEVLTGVSPIASLFEDRGSPIGYVPLDDPSLELYNLCWHDNTTRRDLCKAADFPSGYAMTNPNEHFAEAYNLFVLHGDRFRRMAEDSVILQATYDFFANVVFANRTFVSARDSRLPLVYDSTLIPVDFYTFYERQNDLMPEDRAVGATQIRLKTQRTRFS